MQTLYEIKKRLAALVTNLAEFQASTFEKLESNPLYGDADTAPSAKELRYKQKVLYQDRRRQEAMHENWLAEKLHGPLLSAITIEKYHELLDRPFKSEYFFALYAERHAAFLINKGFFSKEEIEESKAVIGKAPMQSCLMFNDYVVADEDGNTIEAQKILAEYLTTAKLPPAPAASQPPPPAPKKFLYSEAVETYIAAKLQENAWKPHNVPDIRSRRLQPRWNSPERRGCPSIFRDMSYCADFQCSPQFGMSCPTGDILSLNRMGACMTHSMSRRPCAVRNGIASRLIPFRS